jgi:hypothetical protein
MNSEWQRTFRNRMHDFEAGHKVPVGAVPVSIKVRVSSGCYHREHSPHAYSFIDRHLSELHMYNEFSFEEHESGPELLVFVAVVTAGISLAKSVIDLIVAIIKARSEGIKKGDHPASPLDLIVRRTYNGEELREETVLRIGHDEAIDRKIIEERLSQSISRLLLKEESRPTSQTSVKKSAARRRRTPPRKP